MAPPPSLPLLLAGLAVATQLLTPAAAHSNSLCKTSTHAALVVGPPPLSVVRPVVAQAGRAAVVAFETATAPYTLMAAYGVDVGLDTVEPEKEWSSPVNVTTAFTQGSASLAMYGSTAALLYANGDKLMTASFTAAAAETALTNPAGAATGPAEIGSSVAPLAISAAAGSSGFYAVVVKSDASLAVFASADGAKGWASVSVTGLPPALVLDVASQVFVMSAVGPDSTVLFAYRDTLGSLAVGRKKASDAGFTKAGSIPAVAGSGAVAFGSVSSTAAPFALTGGNVTGAFLAVTNTDGKIMSSFSADFGTTWLEAQNVSTKGKPTGAVAAAFSNLWIVAYDGVTTKVVLAKATQASVPNSAAWGVATEENAVSANSTMLFPGVSLGGLAASKYKDGFTLVAADSGMTAVRARACPDLPGAAVGPQRASVGVWAALAAVALVTGLNGGAGSGAAAGSQ